MHLTQHADYALRVLIYLGLRRDRLVTIREVARCYGISRNHLMKVVQRLGSWGYVSTLRGKGGGLRLAMPPEQINLGAVLRRAEEGFILVECFDPVNNRCCIAPACLLKKVLYEALESFLATLDRYTLADLLHNRRGLTALLPLERRRDHR
ncbi:MAG TPA: Rrf2 family transcriptional regulator [Alphaproteobacteria bacterium]|nr:Rrf2 family transcriptional regulator [Alphaproteobacteria bacterium]